MTVRSAAIGTVAVINPKQPTRPSEDDESVPFIPMAAVSENGGILAEERRPLSALKSGYTYFERGDILLAKITPCFENGKVAHLDSLSHPFGFGSTEFHVLRPGPDLDPRYLYHAVRSPQFRQAGASRMTGSAGQQRVPAAFVSNYRISVLPLAEQRRIGEMLDLGDAMRRKRQESLRLLDEFLGSLFLEMFGDPMRNEKAWDLRRLGDCLLEKPVIGTITPASETGELRVIRVGELGTYNVAIERAGSVSVSASEIERFETLEGDLLLARAIGSEQHLGKASVMQKHPDRVLFDSHVMRLRFDPANASSSFVWQLLRSPGGRRLLLMRGGRTAVQFNINASQLAELRLPLPPIDLQKRYVTLALRARAIHSKQDAASVTTNKLLNSLALSVFEPSH